MSCCSPTKLVGAQVHWIQVRKKNTRFAKYFSTVCPPGLEGFPWLAYSWSSKALVCFALSAQLWMVWDWLHGLHKWYQIATYDILWLLGSFPGGHHVVMWRVLKYNGTQCYTISRHGFNRLQPMKLLHSASQESQPCIKAMSNAPAPKEKAKKSRKHDTQSWAPEKHVCYKVLAKKFWWFANLQSCHVLSSWFTSLMHNDAEK